MDLGRPGTDHAATMNLAGTDDALRALPPHVAQRLRLQQVRGHYSSSNGPLVVGLVFSAVLAWSAAPSAGTRLAWGWAAVRALSTLLRLLDAWRFAHDTQQEAHIERWGSRYLRWVLFDGLCYGAIGVLFVPSGNADLDAVMLCSVAGIATVGVFTLLGSLNSAVLWVSLTLLPTVAFHAVQGGSASILASLGLMMFWAMLILESRHVARQLYELAWLRHQNEWIAQQHRQAAAAGRAQQRRQEPLPGHREPRDPHAAERHPGPDAAAAARPGQRRTAAPAAAGGRFGAPPAHHHRRHPRHGAHRVRPAGADRRKLRPGDPGGGRGRHAPPAGARQGLQLQLHMTPELPTRWRGDPARIRQVLDNLLGNAIKFTQQGQVSLRVDTGPAGLRFTVNDSGSGIAPDALQRVFEPFEQADNAPSRAAGGSGLGLAIARQLARAMGGDVGCTDSSSAGSTFVFDLGARPQPSGTQREQGSGPAQVLVVEDNEVNAIVATEMLRRLGCEPLLAEGGEQALQLLQTRAVDLVLMDCQMPGIDGYETTRRWRAQEAEQGRPRLPIIAVTANATPGDREACLAAGMDEHLPKPFELDSLKGAIQRHLPAPTASR
jgi:CheY-like chemotaxis protein